MNVLIYLGVGLTRILIPRFLVDGVIGTVRLIRGKPSLKDISSIGGNTKLHEAIRSRNQEMVDKFKTDKSIINKQNDIGYTPLMEAAYLGDRQTVMSLIAHGADKSIIGKNGHMAWTVARDRGHNELSKELK